MIEPDTIKLLRECDAGVHMGTDAIDEILENVHNSELRRNLLNCREKHEKLADEIEDRLESYGDEGKELSPISKSMAWIKTNLKLAMDDSDHAVADIMTDGCDMGIKSLNRYLNQYPAADEGAKNIAHRLISLEQAMEDDLQAYL